MLVGSDVSIDECKASGYPVIAYGKDLFPNGYLDIGCSFTFIVYDDSGFDDNLKPIKGRSQYDCFQTIDYAHIIDRYLDDKAGIDSYADIQDNWPLDTANLTIHNIVSIAFSVWQYNGL